MLKFSKIGQGKPILWVHGILGNRYTLQKLAKNTPGLHYLVDLRNHGKSFHSYDMSWDALVNDLIKIMDFQNIEEFSIVGQSFGGEIAMKTALNFPKRIFKLLILDIAPNIDWKSAHPDEYNDLLNSLNYMRNQTLKSSRILIQEDLKKNIKNQDIVGLAMTNLIIERQKYKWRLGADQLINFMKQHQGLILEQGKYDNPSLMIAGQQSRFTNKNFKLGNSLTLQDLFLPYFPNIDIQVVENAGHWVQLHNFEKVLAIINSFLQF